MTSSVRLFDKYIAVDWSAKNTPTPAKPSSDALWVGEKDVLEGTQKESYWRTRHTCLNYIRSILDNAVSKRQRVIIGYDLDFGFPAGFVDALELSGTEPKWKRLWDKLVDLIEDDETNRNNRFDVAARLNTVCIVAGTQNIGPLWGCPQGQHNAALSATSPTYPFTTKNGYSLRKKRWTEIREPKAQPVWKLIGTASVGGQTLVGIPAIAKLRYDPTYMPFSRIWPFETKFQPPVQPAGTPFILHVEIWPGILVSQLDLNIAIKDQAQVRATVDWMDKCDYTGLLYTLLGVPDDLPLDAQNDCINEEGWVLGSGYIRANKNPSTEKPTQMEMFNWTDE